MKVNGIRPEGGLLKPEIKNNQDKNKPNFSEILNAKTSVKKDVNFSKHAAQRMEERNLVLNDHDMKKISDAIDLADARGIRNALIISEEITFIVHIKSRTIVTAVDKENMKDKVFTNVDGAVNI